MNLSCEQLKAIKLLSEAYSALSKVWSDELGEEMNDRNLLPVRCLDEAEAECLDIYFSNSKQQINEEVVMTTSS